MGDFRFRLLELLVRAKKSVRDARVWWRFFHLILDFIVLREVGVSFPYFDEFIWPANVLQDSGYCIIISDSSSCPPQLDSL